ncbi:hypothetical protein EBR96_06410 [bacterium]|nr:hypothetical protein [bacterium]
MTPAYTQKKSGCPNSPESELTFSITLEFPLLTSYFDFQHFFEIFIFFYPINNTQFITFPV